MTGYHELRIIINPILYTVARTLMSWNSLTRRTSRGMECKDEEERQVAERQVLRNALVPG